MELIAGDIVYSKAGRDKDRLFVVLEVLDDAFALLADGKLRKVEKPKKKKIKHLKKTNMVAMKIKQKILAKEKVKNSEIKEILAEL